MSLAPPDPVADLGLRGTIAVVTAAGRGIGRATALLLARWGATVIAVDRDAEALAPVVEEMVRLGCRAEAAPADVCDETAVAALFASVAERHSRVDILVNAVGGGKPAALETISAAEWTRMLDFNVTSCFLCAREAARHMPDGGRIVNVASLAGVSTSQLQGAHYTAGKAAVIGLTRHLARELGPRGIRVMRSPRGRRSPSAFAPRCTQSGNESWRRGCRSGGWPRPTIRPASSFSWPRHSPRTSPV